MKSVRLSMGWSGALGVFALTAMGVMGSAHADDLDLIQAAAGSSGNKLPPNIMWLFDSSTTMRNFVCVDYTSGSTCTTATLAARNVINGAKVCENTVLRDVVGIDVTGDDVGDTYRSLYADDGTTFDATAPYAVFDERKAGTTDDQTLSWTIKYHPGAFNTAWSTYTTATGAGTSRAKIDAAINTWCNSSNMRSCEQQSRCHYSIKTQGYWWEPSGNTCASGDPLNMCVGLRANGVACTANTQCTSRLCTGTPKVCTAQTLFTYPTPFVTGDFLNFYPPKNIGLIDSFRDAISTMAADARLGISDYGDAASGGNVRFEIQPPCVQAMDEECLDGDAATQCFNPGDPNLENYLFNNYIPTSATAPIARLLDNVGDYYTATTGVSTPICDYSSLEGCGDANNFVVIVADGLPSGDAVSVAGLPFMLTKVPDLTDGYYLANGSLADDVARALTQIDFRDDIDGVQNVVTYTVSYGATDPADPDKCLGILEDIANAGSGRCIPASNAEELETALGEVLDEIFRRAYGYTAPSVPTTRMQGESSLSNAVFVPTSDFPLWEGHVFSFSVCDEFLAEQTGAPCTCVADGESDDVCILDADGADIAYDDEGNLLSRPHWDAALCLAGDAAGSLGIVDPDQSDMDVSGCYRSAEKRNIFTGVADHSAPGDEVGAGDLITFDAATVSSSAALLTALAAADEATAQQIVNFYRGYDAYDHDGDGDTTEDRNLNNMQDGSGELVEGWWKLGDIFHSIPETVRRPNGEGGGLSRGSTSSIGSWATTPSFLKYAEAYDSRDRVMLVGANDGMLHAFHAGTWDSAADAYDFGTGEELWAFVSPELLPGLKDVCDAAGGGCTLGTHTFRVDGSVMVRDSWIGGDKDMEDESNADLWRTIAVYGHRDGGSTYIGLDVTDPSSPTLLWQFPQPGSIEATIVGKSWLDVKPSPASIGPVAELVDGASVPRWVVLLSGGFDQLDRKGNALFMLDVYTGEVLWSVTRELGGATDQMRYSFPATPSFWATSNVVSSGEATAGRPYIEGFVAADHGGQVWRVMTPAQEMTGGRFTYEAKLVFSALPDSERVYSDGDDVLEPSDYQRRPFYFGPAITFNDDGNPRVILASGDRDQLIPVSALDDTIEGYLCEDQQRLYAFDIMMECTTTLGVSRTCYETDLTQVDPAAGDEASPVSDGWYYVLPSGEKSATPYAVANQFAFYATFNPNVACGTSSNVCATESQGEARLYALHFQTGGILDWDGDGVASASEIYQYLGAGVPTAPMVSTAVNAAGTRTTVFAGGSDSGQGAASAEGLSVSNLAVEIMRFSVSRDVHAILH